METIRTLPVVYGLLESGDVIQAISIIDQYVEVLAPHIEFAFPPPDSFNEETCLQLCKLYLLRREYRKSIEYALKAQRMLDRLEPFYFEALIYRMMEVQLVGNEMPGLREFVLELIRGDPINDSKLGYLLQMKEFGELCECVKQLSEGQEECRNILLVLLETAPKEMTEILAQCSLENPCFFEHVIDSLVTLEKFDELKKAVSELPWKKMYAACFYLEDTHQYKMEIENENASFILSGQWKQEILSNFLFNNGRKLNFKVIEGLSKARAPYIVLANSFLNAGTTNDLLYRNNRNLIMGKSWNRFLEFASLGMIHQGNIDPFEILKEVLPSLESSSGEPGALMALGIMNAGRNDEETTEYFLNWIDSASEEMVFGACIGLGLNMIQTGDKNAFDRLKQLFSVDNTIIQESALYSIGLIYAGCESEDAIGFVRSIHDKTYLPRVKRVAGLAIALMNAIGRDREDLIEYLMSDDASVRAMGVLSLGTAYAATANLGIIEKIIPLINDGDDDVKRAAVIATALIGYGDPEIKSACLAPMAENHNLFVRSAAALCLGFFSAGLCDVETCRILEAMLYDSEDLVRQAACMGSGFALMQANPTLVPNYKRTMDRINYLLVTRSESQCVKIGASLGKAISETSARCAIYSLKNYSGQVLCTKLVGALLFFQSWYWYPMLPCVSLCHHPTPLYFFDENLDETGETFANSEDYYDLFVKLPEMKKSRKFKPGRPEQSKDIMEPSKNGLKSGDRLTYKERMSNDMGSGIFFKD